MRYIDDKKRYQPKIGEIIKMVGYEKCLITTPINKVELIDENDYCLNCELYLNVLDNSCLKLECDAIFRSDNTSVIFLPHNLLD